ncbi:MAG: M20 family metallopeptidase [Pyrinomonadaceae bacterium]|nr:M20 family metallopeptidase [Pyrinomonadaceae bacterium]MBP6213839.1 M20 family metallopeptidase [Pyrinomonadaceae bacterium]
MTPHETLQYFRTRQSAIVDAIREIVDIESPSHDAVRSREVVDWVEAKMRSAGIEAAFERIKVDDGEHLIIRAFPSAEPHTFILGHTDTVHPVGTHLQNPTRIEGDKFYGCGIFDMKANIVLMFEALRFCAVNGVRPRSPITILLSCDEEVGSHTGREFVEREARGAERCLVFEPSAEGRIKSGRKGTGQYTLRARGIPAHAGLEPEKGANAVAEIARHIDAIHAIQNADLGTTVNVCTIKGGTTSNVIPEHAECEIDVRFSKMSEGERVDAALHSIRSIDERVSLEMIGAVNRPPLERTAAVAALFETARSLGASFGYEVGETQVGGASDGNFVAALGVPVLDGLGIAGSGAHRLDEHILVSDITNRATLVTMLLIS